MGFSNILFKKYIYYSEHAVSNNNGSVSLISSAIKGLCRSLKIPVPIGAGIPIIMFSETPLILSVWPW